MLRRAEQRFGKTGETQRLFTASDYAAGSWRYVRWVIAKAEHADKGRNPRFIATNIVGAPQRLYDRRYRQRGEMENRVNEQMMLFADRVSVHRWWPNQWRLCLSAIPYTLLEALRRLALGGTVRDEATFATLRAKLLKIGAVIVRKLAIVRLHLSSRHPRRDVFQHAHAVLVPT